MAAWLGHSPAAALTAQAAYTEMLRRARDPDWPSSRDYWRRLAAPQGRDSSAKLLSAALNSRASRDAALESVEALARAGDSDPQLLADLAALLIEVAAAGGKDRDRLAYYLGRWGAGQDPSPAARDLADQLERRDRVMTYDPVTVIERPKTGLFKGLPSAGPGSVLVVDREGSRLRVLDGPGDRLTAGEVRWGQIRKLFEVDVTEHPLQFTAVFPCRDDTGGFKAEVALHCIVTDPAAVVRRGVRDVARVLFPPVTETLRRVCGRYPAEDYQQAEAAGLNAIRELEHGPRHDPAFRISQIHLVLTLDGAAATFVRDRKEATRDLARQQDAARLDREKAQLQAELERSGEQFEQERLRMQLEERPARSQGRRPAAGTRPGAGRHTRDGGAAEHREPRT